mgnify:CR=1 FL=1
MSEFEKELEKFNLKNGTDYRTLNQYSDVLTTHFKDWQPPKELVEVPQCVADWFENQLKNNESKKFDGNDVFRIIQDVIKVSNDESTWEDYGITDEIAKFAEDNEELFLNLIVNCSVGNGYTVKKEVYVLKHIDFCKTDKDYDWFMIKFSDGALNHLRVEKGQKPATIDCRFTQSEIDDMEVGSYEQIEVEK